MIKSILEKFMLLTAALTPLNANSKNKQDYFPPYFKDQERLAKIQSIIPKINTLYKEFSDQHHFPGYTFGIMLDGHLVYSKSEGYTNIDQKIPVTPESLFRVASITKNFTAMAILKLRDEGKIRLDDPVYLYIPELKHQYLTTDSADITIRDLLIHAAGFPEDNYWGDRKLEETEEDLLSLIKKGLSFSNTPGNYYEYSNLGYAMLGYIIKKVSRIPYQAFIEKNICLALNMKQVAWEFTKILPDQLVYGYKWDNNTWHKEPLLHDGIYNAMGGMFTSLESFSKYVAFHQNAWPARNEREMGPIKRSSIREMHQAWKFNRLVLNNKNPKEPDTIFTESYGYGLSWSRDLQQNTYIGHSGGLPGFGSNWMIMPDYGIGVILFANLTYAPAREINLKVLKTLQIEAQLNPHQIPASPILQRYKEVLSRLLPEWNKAEESGIFSEHFFLDFPLGKLKQEAAELFKQAGKIKTIGDLTPENQLRGYFILEGEHAKIKIYFGLTPENTPQIQLFTQSLIQ